MTDRSSGLFELDALLPDQFYAAFRGSAAARGERRLMLAVLQDALDCYQKYAHAHDAAGRQMFADAAAWIACEDRRWYFSFENICSVLEIDPTYLRRGLSEKNLRVVPAPPAIVRRGAGEPADGRPHLSAMPPPAGMACATAAP